MVDKLRVRGDFACQRARVRSWWRGEWNGAVGELSRVVGSSLVCVVLVAVFLFYTMLAKLRRFSRVTSVDILLDFI